MVRQANRPTRACRYRNPGRGDLRHQTRTAGTRVPDEELEDSDLILPAADSTLEEVQQLLSESEEGLIPGVSTP